MEKEKKSNGFHLVLRQAPDSMKDFLSRFFLGIAVLIALGCTLWDGLNLAGSSCYFAVVAACGVLYCLLGCDLPEKFRFARYIKYIAVILLAVYAMLASKWIVDGWNLTLNQICGGLEIHLGRIFPRYAVSVEEELYPLCATLFLVLPAALLGLIAGWTAGGRVVLLLLADALLLIVGILGLYTPNLWTVLLLLVTAVALARRTTRRNNYSDGGGMIVWLAVVMAVLSAIAIIPAFMAGDGTAAADARRWTAEREIYHLRYEPEEQILTRGDLAALGDFTPDETKTLMTLEMSEPTSVYLKGFVGERYVGDGWVSLPAAQKAESTTDFSWLHSRGFYGQNQIAELADMLNLESALVKVDVDNLSAGSGYRYAPYELKTGDPDENQIGDSELAAAGLHGERQYEYYMTNFSALNYEQLYAALSSAWADNEPEAVTYLENENVYRDYAYANYLDVPEEAQAAINELLGGQEIPENVSFQYAVQAVQACLNAALTYNETPKAYEGGDFLTFLFEDSHEGYSVHYATAATLLFRSFGVPARYVEGYYVSPEQAAAAAESGEPIEVTEENAHAWVEIYRNGVGFVPFEVTPSSNSSDDQNQQNQDNAGGAEEPQEQTNPLNLLLLLLLLVLGVLLLLLIVFVVLAVRRQIIRSRWANRLAEATLEQRADVWTAYAVKLLGCLGIEYKNGSLYGLYSAVNENLGAEQAAKFGNVVKIQQQARFSDLPISEEQFGAVCGFAEEIAAELKGRSKWTERFKLKYLQCLI
jgi:hypothetical protein